MIEVGILGASGYAGSELVRLLVQREDVQLNFLGANRQAGSAVSDLYPNVYQRLIQDYEVVDLQDPKTFNGLDLLFSCLPHGQSQAAVAQAYQAGVRVIDFSADYRLKSPKTYEGWYNTKHAYPKLLAEAVYGLTELHRQAIEKAAIIANPGCFPTAMLLGLAPLTQAGLLDWVPSIIADCKSGLSGAGRNLQGHLLFTEVNENVNPYAAGVHRHTPEVEEQLHRLQGSVQTQVNFIPHLVPTQRGILASLYVQAQDPITEDELREMYQTFYKGASFIRILKEGIYPQMKAVTGSNYVDIQVQVNERTGLIYIFVAIDNLIKGAAGQAVQNMNVMFNLPEETGLTAIGLLP